MNQSLNLFHIAIAIEIVFKFHSRNVIKLGTRDESIGTKNTIQNRAHKSDTKNKYRQNASKF